MASLTVSPTTVVVSVAAGPVGVSSAFSSRTEVRLASMAPMAAPLRVSRGARIVAMATPQQQQSAKSAVEKAIEDAEELCSADDSTPGCANAWDEVEELAAHASHMKNSGSSSKDPLEKFCEDNPETDECRVYED